MISVQLYKFPTRIGSINHHLQPVNARGAENPLAQPTTFASYNKQTNPISLQPANAIHGRIMPAANYRFLTAAQVNRLHARHIARAPPTQPAMLGSAVHSPLDHHRYGQTDLFQLAGVLSEKLILNHPYQDGNKRTALFATDMFLRRNGYQLQSAAGGDDNKALADAHVCVATREWTSEDVGRHHASIAKPVPCSWIDETSRHPPGENTGGGTNGG